MQCAMDRRKIGKASGPSGVAIVLSLVGISVSNL